MGDKIPVILFVLFIAWAFALVTWVSTKIGSKYRGKRATLFLCPTHISSMRRGQVALLDKERCERCVRSR